MTGARATAAAIVLGVLFTWGMLRLFGLQYSAGDFYPEYSSLRADPHGAKLLFDSVTRLPGLHPERNYLPLDYFVGGRAALLLLGLRLEEISPALLAQMEKLARRGHRVVMAFAFQETSRRADLTPLGRIWNARLSLDGNAKDPHPLSFEKSADWTVRGQIGPKVLAMERKFGDGTVLLFAESSAFSNEALADTKLELPTIAIGPATRIVFDEQHFGIEESGSVVGLARQLRLMGLVFGLAIVAALALWNNTSAFPRPQPIPVVDHHIGRTSFEGLVTLLQRHVRTQELAAACWEEWLKANRHRLPPERLREVSEIAATGGQRPLDAVRQMQAGLHAKGEL